MTDLSKVSIDDLHAEIARRKAAAQAKGRPMRYATKAAWARAKAGEAQVAKDELKKQSGTGGEAGTRSRHEQYKALDKEIEKFSRLAADYQRKGI